MTTLFEAPCPTCGYRADAHTAVGDEDAVPKPGDVSLCIACGALAVYEPVMGSALVLRLPTTEERDEFLANDLIVKAMLAQREGRATMPNWPRGPRER